MDSKSPIKKHETEILTITTPNHKPRKRQHKATNAPAPLHPDAKPPFDRLARGPFD